MLWRPVLAGLDTLSAVRSQWSIDDLFDAHEILDIREAAEAQALQKARGSRA